MMGQLTKVWKAAAYDEGSLSTLQIKQIAVNQRK